MIFLVLIFLYLVNLSHKNMIVIVSVNSMFTTLLDK